MSDSLKATLIVSVLVFTISANPELELEEPEPPRLPEVVPDPLDEEEELFEAFDDEELPDPPPDTASPTDRLDREAIVPLTGAYSLVLFTAVSALCTPACAEYTAAWAEAMLPGEGVEVVVVDVVEVVFDVDFPALEDDDGEVLGTTTVTVTLGVFLTVVVVLVPGFDFFVGAVGVVPGWKAAYCTVPPGAV
jgi:hypothetical protein